MNYKEYIEKAKEYIIGNNIEEGKTILKKLIMEGIEDKDVYLEMGKCYINEDKEKAIKNIERYMELGGKDINVGILLAKLYKEIGDIQKSREILEEMIELNIEGLIELFRINIMEGNKEKAIKNIEDMDKKYKGEIKEIEEVAEEYIKWGEYERLERIIKNNKANIKEEKYHYYLYKCYNGIGEKDKSIKEIEYLKYRKEYEKDIKDWLIIEAKKDWNYVDSDIIYNIIDILCKYIEEDDTDSDIIRSLAILLRKNMYDEEKKEKIKNILERYRQNSKKPRACNIFFNEIEILEKKTILKSNPRHITVQLTTKCNLKCPMCWVYKNNYIINNDVFNFIKSNMPYLENVVWQGGEVFLYDKFDELIDLAGYYGVKQTILTNGLLLNKKRIELLSKYCIKIKISIDAVDKENYEKIREGGKFDNLLKVLEQLRDEKTKNKNFGYMMAVVINALNYKKIEEIVDFAIKYGFECLTFQNFIVNSQFQSEDLCLNIEQSEEILKKVNFFIKQSLSGKIPIKIEANFNLKTTEDLLGSYKRSIGMKNYFKKTRVEGQYRICFSNLYKGNNKVSSNNKLTCFNPWGLDKNFNPIFLEQKLFCVSPWTKVYLDINNIMRSVCNGYAIDISNSFKNIWNNKKLVEYRAEIIKGNISKCTIICRNSGEYGYKTTLGIC